MYTFRTETDLAAFEAFVLANGGIYMQSAKWAQVKLEWNSRFYAGFDEGGTRVLTALVMERHIPAAGKLWYSPAGAVCDYRNAVLLKEFAAFMKSEMKKAIERRPGCNYRICHACSKEWNVARNQKERHYICPKCAETRRNNTKC